MTAYSDLTAHFGRIAALSNAVGILQWDSDTMMPKGAAETRAESMALLHVMRHGLATDARIGDWLAEAESDSGLGPWEKANLREIRRLWTVDTALPADLVEASSKAVSACEMRWRQARAEADFAGLLPYLAEVLNLQRQIGNAKGRSSGSAPMMPCSTTTNPAAARRGSTHCSTISPPSCPASPRKRWRCRRAGPRRLR